MFKIHKVYYLFVPSTNKLIFALYFDLSSHLGWMSPSGLKVHEKKNIDFSKWTRLINKYLNCFFENLQIKIIILLFQNRDRFRTMNNLIGDCYTVAIVQHLSKEELEVSVWDDALFFRHLTHNFSFFYSKLSEGREKTIEINQINR